MVENWAAGNPDLDTHKYFKKEYILQHVTVARELLYYLQRCLYGGELRATLWEEKKAAGGGESLIAKKSKV